MATLAGTLTIPAGGYPYTGKFRVQMVDAPKAVGPGITGTGIPAFVQCNEAGQYSISLPAGNYVVNIPNTRAFLISVPPTGSYDMDDLVVEQPTTHNYYVTVMGSLVGIPGIEALRSITASNRQPNQIATTLWAYTEGDGQELWYRWNASSTEADNGISVVRPNDVAPGAPGRWIRMGHQ